MIIVTVDDDGRAVIPKAALDRLGVRPGDKLELNDRGENGAAELRLHALPKDGAPEAAPFEAELVEKNGVWVLRTRPLTPEEAAIDWVDVVRRERNEFLARGL